MTTLTGCPAPALDVRPEPATQVTHEGAAWLASACTHPRSALTVWEERPAAPAVLPCGVAFDVVNVPLVLGRRMLDLLWAEGPGCGPAAVHRGRMLLFAAPGTAQRLPALLAWVGEPPTKPGEGGARTRRPRSVTGRATPSPFRRSSRWPDPRAGWWHRTPGGPGCPGPTRCCGRSCTPPACRYRFFVPPIGMLMSTTSAGAASSVG
ncbi:hypothetical protein [Streptomyces cirratus]|uniref:hypothetical protein n=1 Tax=Streptomyces cirratus TaxID=68187 RepID=UPI00361F3489